MSVLEIAVFLLVLAAIFLVAGARTRKRRIWLTSALVSSGICLALLLGILASMFFSDYFNPQPIAISGKHDNHFNFDIRHTRMSMDGAEYRFRPRVSVEEMQREFTAQYPHGDVDGDRLSVILGGLRFIVEPDDEEGVWAAYRQTVTLIDQDMYFSDISFPTGVVKEDELSFDKPAPLLVNRQEVFDELALLGTPVAEDGTVFVGTVNQGILHMTFTADTVTVNRL